MKTSKGPSTGDCHPAKPNPTVLTMGAVVKHARQESVPTLQDPSAKKAAKASELQ